MRRSLLENNPYLPNREQREQILVRNDLDSSAIEGARGLRTPRYRFNSGTARRRSPAKKSASDTHYRIRRADPLWSPIRK